MNAEQNNNDEKGAGYSKGAANNGKEGSKQKLQSQTETRPSDLSSKFSIDYDDLGEPIIVNLEEERRKLEIMSKYNAQRAFCAMFDVLEGQHEKGPISLNHPFILPPDESLSTFKLEELQQQIMKMEKKLKTVTRRLQESKREKLDLTRKIESLQVQLIHKEAQRVLETIMDRTPTQHDIERLETLQEKLAEKAKIAKELKLLQKKHDALNKTLKNAEVIITESSAIKKHRHVVIVDPRDTISEIKDFSKIEDARIRGSSDQFSTSTQSRRILASEQEREGSANHYTRPEDPQSLARRVSIEAEHDKRKGKSHDACGTVLVGGQHNENSSPESQYTKLKEGDIKIIKQAEGRVFRNRSALENEEEGALRETESSTKSKDSPT